jgi:hypothetical protein
MPDDSHVEAIAIAVVLAVYWLAWKVYSRVIERRFAPLLGDD